MINSSPEERSGKDDAMQQGYLGDLVPKASSNDRQQDEVATKPTSDENIVGDPILGAAKDESIESKAELAGGQQPVKIDDSSLVNFPALPIDVRPPLQADHSSGPSDPFTFDSPTQGEVDKSMPLKPVQQLEDDSQRTPKDIEQHPEPNAPVLITDSNSENEQEEGEAFSVKYITQLTSVTGPIEEEEVPGEPLPVSHQQSVSSNDADLNDFVKLDKPTVRVEGERSSLTAVLSPYKDNLAEVKPPAMSGPSAAEKTSTALIDQLVESQLGQVGEEPRDLLESLSDKVKSMNEPPDVPMDFHVPAKPFFFDEPKSMKPLEADDQGNDKFSTEEGDLESERQNKVGKMAANLIDSDLGVNVPTSLLEPVTAEFSLPKVADFVASANEMGTPPPKSEVEKRLKQPDPELIKRTKESVEPWIGEGVLDERVRRLIYWEEPAKSAAVFIVIFASLVAIRLYSFVSAAAFAALCAMLCGPALRLYGIVMRVGNTPEERKKVLQSWVALELPREKIHVQVDVIVDGLQKLLQGCQAAFLGGKKELIRLTFIVLSLYVAGEMFTLLGLVHFGIVMVFTVPFLLKKYNKEVQEAMIKAKQAYNRTHSTINEKVPLMARVCPTLKVD
ncbi:Reticulon-like protein [Trichuris trichiura]|uniref:Reticulon-like protein n=1 Tax=Trichuris trichiura TaxID=36087 RepID=A0A077Z7P1_TRITR|nr:Reticulon-like protein [Trichuris trichiura]